MRGIEEVEADIDRSIMALKLLKDLGVKRLR